MFNVGDPVVGRLPEGGDAVHGTVARLVGDFVGIELRDGRGLILHRSNVSRANETQGTL